MLYAKREEAGTKRVTATNQTQVRVVDQQTDQPEKQGRSKVATANPGLVGALSARLRCGRGQLPTFWKGIHYEWQGSIRWDTESESGRQVSVS